MSEGGKDAGEGFGDRAEPAVMRRLLDEATGDPLTARGWAVGLLRRTGPHRSPVGRKQRVRLALGQGGRRRALPLVRTAIAGLVLVGCGAAASAALGRWPEIVQAYRRLAAPSSPAIGASEPRARRGATGQPPRAGSSLARVETDSAETSAPPTVRGPAPSSVSRASLHGSSGSFSSSSGSSSSRSWRPRRASHAEVAMAPTTKHRAASQPAPASSSAPAPVTAMTEDTTPVLEAMRALRVEARPARARRLLAGYLDRYPNGSLAEEALAMTIEAAVAHGDGDATALARKYVRRYPAGHFSAMARRTLDGATGVAN